MLGCAANLLTRVLYQQAKLCVRQTYESLIYMKYDTVQLVQYSVVSEHASTLHIWHLEVGTRKTYQYMDMCDDILIVVYRLCHMVFSVPITKCPLIYPNVNRGLAWAP
jgi:hypothetical protein